MIKQIVLFLLAITLVMTSCKKDNNPLEGVDTNVDYFSKREPKPKAQWNELDYLCDSIQKTYGVEVIYEFSPRIIDGTTYFTPAEYDKALNYTRLVLDSLWLKPLKESFPKFFEEQTPIEFIIAGGFVHFNDITDRRTAAGAGLNAQFYRLGMGGINNFSRSKSWLHDHMVTLYHEHAHQIDRKFGRGENYDLISQGKYYGLAGYRLKPNTDTLRTDIEAQRDGFMKPYGGYAAVEDFATTVEYAVKFPRDSIMSFISRSQDLETKYRMIYQKYLDMGVDLHSLHVVLDSVVNQVN